jgi:hypothetical protein
MADADVRWSLKVSQETDLSLRTYPGARGMKKGDPSKFVEEAVRVADSRSNRARDQGTQ